MNPLNGVSSKLRPRKPLSFPAEPWSEVNRQLTLDHGYVGITGADKNLFEGEISCHNYRESNSAGPVAASPEIELTVPPAGFHEYDASTVHIL